MVDHTEHDAVTGRETTGHEWDGIKELNTPLPRWWVYVFYATIVWSIGYWIVYPAWPGISGYTRGLFDYSSREQYAEQVASTAEARKVWTDQFKGQPIEQIVANTDLLNYGIAGGRAVFAANCTACHGAGGQGGKGYPTLADDDWLWGGDLASIQQTITHGVRSSADPDTRQSEMPRFGVDGLLTPEQISDVAEFVLSLSNRSNDAVAAGRGKAIFADQCAACHGEAGGGNSELGAPNLTDEIWLYGAERQDIIAQITNPHMGVMPNWRQRFDETTIKMLTIYVHSLGAER
jgi:cytochrome c oxidase cbb3-type subunit III